VVVTHNLLKTMYADGRADERRRQTVRERYAMTPDGLLVIETLIVADPRPSERPPDPPANWQRYFEKAS
jgi:hypothetical protein